MTKDDEKNTGQEKSKAQLRAERREKQVTCQIEFFFS